MIQLSNGALTFVVDGVAYSAPVYMAHGSETALVAHIRQAVAAAIVSGNPPEIVGASAGKATFDPRTATIRWGSETITPETPLTDYPADIQAFVQAIYTFNDNEQTKIWNALQVEVIEPDRHPEPLTPEQERALEEKQALETFNNAVAALTRGYTKDQIDSWPEKARQAQRVLEGETTGTVMIDTEAKLEVRERVDVASRVLALVDVYSEGFLTAENAYKVAMKAIAEKYSV